MLALACDHGGLALKKEIAKYLSEKGIEYKDFGTHTEDSCDYPLFGAMAARAVASGECEKGIIFCGTGIGISIAANKVKGIRCVVCSEPFSAKLSRMHNNSNMLALGGRVVGTELAKMIVDEWLSAEFEGQRHQRRIDLISKIEEEN